MFRAYRLPLFVGMAILDRRFHAAEYWMLAVPLNTGSSGAFLLNWQTRSRAAHGFVWARFETHRFSKDWLPGKSVLSSMFLRIGWF
jgi:hypothetical protein